MSTKLTINNHSVEVDLPPDTPLVWVLRDTLKLTGTKFGCGVASCGACTVHVNGEPMRSCQLPLEDAAGLEITTIEGAGGKITEAVQAAWRALDVVQCGYCQSGQIMSAVGLLSENPKPTDSDIDEYMDGNVCRCATYVRIKAAIHDASARLEA